MHRRHVIHEISLDIYGMHTSYINIYMIYTQQVSNGYKKKAWTMASDPTISIFKGSTLIARKIMIKGKIDENFPVGSYSCMVRHLNFYTGAPKP